MKVVVVSGGVISGLGKGITTSSMGRLLKARGTSGGCRNRDVQPRSRRPELSRWNTPNSGARASCSAEKTGPSTQTW